MLTRITDCACSESGWCPRHQCEKTAHWHRLCQRRQDYFDLWEDGRGPGQGETSRRQITVLMVTCNRLEYTQRALDTLLASVPGPMELVIWDNASTDGTRDWLVDRLKDEPRAALYLSPRNVGAVRPMNVVWSAARTPLLVKVDNDTLVPPDLLARLADCLLANPQAGVVSGCHFRADDVGELRNDTPRSPGGQQIWHQPNVGGCAVMLRKELFDHFGPIPCRHTHSASPFVDRGWTEYQQRLHAAGYINGYPLPLIFVEHMEDTRSPWCITSAAHEEYKQAMRGRSLQECTDQAYRNAGRHLAVGTQTVKSEMPADVDVTLFIPLAGRAALWPSLADFLTRQSFPRERTRLFLLDTSQDSEFSVTVRRWMSECDYPDVRYRCEPVGSPGLADRPRRDVSHDVRQAMATIYNRLRQELTTDFVWILEDDILPPPDVGSRLLAGFDVRTVSVAAPYRSRFGDRYVAWDRGGRSFLHAGDGLQSVGGHGLGCALIRTREFCAVPFRPSDDCDRAFGRRMLAADLTTKVDWSCACRHLNSDAVAGENATA